MISLTKISKFHINEKLLKIAICLCSAATLLPYFGSKLVTIELLSHFKLPLLFLSLSLLIFSVQKKKKIIILLMTLIAIANALEIIPLYFKKNTPIGEETIKVISSNVQFNNESKERVIDFIKNENPDILMLQELNEDWENEIATLKTMYDFTKVIDPKNNFGIGIFSKYEITDIYVVEIEQYNSPTLITNIDTKIGPVRFINIHPVPPISQKFLELRDITYGTISSEIKKNELPTVVAGDFNSTIFSPAFKKILSETGLNLGDRGFGYNGTFPNNHPNYKNPTENDYLSLTTYIPRFIMNNSILKLPIDHVLTSKDIAVSNLQLGENIGSDHLPLVFEIGKVDL